MDTVSIRILFFGSLKAHFGDQLQMPVSRGLEVQDLIEILKTKSPGASDILLSCQVAVNSEVERTDFRIDQSCELAILPPFSGG